MAPGPISPPAVERGGRFELPAYLSNGLVGLRVLDVPLQAGFATISGYAGEHSEKKIEALERAPYPLGGGVSVNGVSTEDALHCIRVLDQSYDFSCGELTTRFIFNADGVAVSVQVLTFCDRKSPSLVCQEILATVDRQCTLRLDAGISTFDVPGVLRKIAFDVPGKSAPVDCAIRWESVGAISTCGLAYFTAFDGADKFTRDHSRYASQFATWYGFEAEPSRPYRLRQVASVVPSALHRQPDLQAARLAALAAENGFEKIRRENREQWNDLWQGRIRLIGADERWQAMADAAFYYLNSSVHASSPASTSIFGLSTWKNYHYYYGHVMWDIETFNVPVVTLLQPFAARALLDFRHSHLAGARNNAQVFGRLGLQFPWESSISGEETAPLPGSASWHEDHASLDVALAFSFYAEVTGDDDFFKNKAWPVLSGVAEWIGSRCVKTDRGFEICESMGIAEREEASNNVAYTAMAARLVLEKTIKAARKLNLPVNESLKDIAERLVLPKRGDIVIAHDGYRDDEDKGETPDPLMGAFPLDYPLTRAEEQATLKFYLAKADDYVGARCSRRSAASGPLGPATGKGPPISSRRATPPSCTGDFFRHSNIGGTAFPTNRSPVPSSPTSAAS